MALVALAVLREVPVVLEGRVPEVPAVLVDPVGHVPVAVAVAVPGRGRQLAQGVPGALEAVGPAVRQVVLAGWVVPVRVGRRQAQVGLRRVGPVVTAALAGQTGWVQERSRAASPKGWMACRLRVALRFANC